MRRVAIRSAEERRQAEERELLHPTWPPKLLLSAYPKRGPSGVVAITIQLGAEHGVSLASVLCGDHAWIEATCSV